MKKSEVVPVVELKNIKKDFLVGKEKVPILKDISLQIYYGEFVVIFGPSGCGKSTLLNTILGLEQPTSGEVVIRGKNMYSMNEDVRAKFRHDKFGVVYQQPNWIRSLNVIENIVLPLDIDGVKHRNALKRGDHLLHLFRMDQYRNYRPSELSGGQQQKLSVCRALITNPWIVLADEPTGNLDTVSASDLMYVFKFLNDESKRTFIMVTHNPEYEKYATKVVYMEDGMVKRIDQKRKVEGVESDMKDILSVGEVGAAR